MPAMRAALSASERESSGGGADGAPAPSAGGDVSVTT